MMSFSLAAATASALVGLASLTTPVSVTDRLVTLANCVASMRSISTWGWMVPCASCPNCGISPFSSRVASSMLPT